MVKDKEMRTMTDEEIKQLCNELDATWERYRSYAALSQSVLTSHYVRKNESAINNNNKETKMKSELKKALYLLENIGYTVKPLNESEQKDLVDEIKAKYDEWEELSDRTKDSYYCIPLKDEHK